MTWFLCVSIHVWGRRGFEENTATLFFFFFFLIFLFVTSCTFIFDSFNVSFNRANFQHCRVFNFSFFSFPVRANTRLFRQCVYAGVFVRKRVTVQTMCASVDWLIRLFRNFFICFCSLTIIIIIMILFPIFRKKKPSSQTNELCNFFLFVSPLSDMLTTLIFDSVIFFHCLQHYRWVERNTTQQKKIKTKLITLQMILVTSSLQFLAIWQTKKENTNCTPLLI